MMNQTKKKRFSKFCSSKTRQYWDTENTVRFYLTTPPPSTSVPNGSSPYSSFGWLFFTHHWASYTPGNSIFPIICRRYSSYIVRSLAVFNQLVWEPPAYVINNKRLSGEGAVRPVYVECTMRPSDGRIGYTFHVFKTHVAPAPAPCALAVIRLPDKRARETRRRR